MHLFILGKTSDDRGSQLETLTRELLESLGYTRLKMNVANDAGEVDVEGQYITPMPVEQEATKLIAECKAHKSPLNMTDWLKFLGKLFVAQAKGDRVVACLVALSGVNGNVLGSYESLQVKGIRLVDSTTLTEYLTRSHSLAPMEKLRSFLNATGRTYLSIDLAYYHRKVFWVIGYDGGRYTVLDANVSYPSESTLDLIRPMIETTVEAGAFVDLRTEQAVRASRLLARKVVISAAMLGNGRTSETEVLDALPSYKVADRVLPEHIHLAIAELSAEGLIAAVNGSSIAFSSAIETDPASRRKLFVALCDETFFTLPLGCDWWDRHIDQNLVLHACAVQEGLTLDQASLQKAEMLMRLSPRALLYALTPDPMIVTHRRTEAAVKMTDDMCEQDRKHFMRSLYEELSVDFRTAALSKYFHSQRRIEAIGRKSQITVYDRDDGVVIDGEVQDTHMIGEWHEKGANGETLYVHLAAIPDFAARRRAAKLERERASDHSDGAVASPDGGPK